MTVRKIVKRLVNLPLGAFDLQIKKKDKQVKKESKSPQLNYDPHRWLKRRKIKTVLDIGANTGEFAAKIRQILPQAEIISFEPLVDCYNKLVENGESLGKFSAYNYALGAENGRVPIHRSEFSQSSSLLPMAELHKKAFPFTRRGSIEEIEIRRLDDVRGLKINKPLLVKIDVQGFEDKVIEGGKSVISQSEVIIVETSFQSLYEGQALFDMVYQQLIALGFSYNGNWGQLDNPLDGTVLQADAIFMKDSKL